MELTNTQIIMLLGLTFCNALLTLLLLIFASGKKRKKASKHSQCGEDFYITEDAEETIESSEDDIKEGKKNKHKIVFIGKLPGKRKPIKNKKKGGKR